MEDGLWRTESEVESWRLGDLRLLTFFYLPPIPLKGRNGGWIVENGKRG